MFRFIHAADIHLDSPLRGLARHENAPVETVRRATRDALQHLVDLACKAAVDFVLIAGDLYDGDWPDYNTGIFFTEQMRRLERAGIPVMVIAGNHDAHSQITKQLRLPANVHTFSAESPQIHTLENPRVAIHGQSFATRAVTENLAAAYPAPVPGVFNIGMLHTALDGRAGHDPYAPCTLESLAALGYDYWALGHVHMREVLNEKPPVVFPGNVQGRHIRETGAKGCYLVHADDQKQCTLEFHALDVVRWAEVTVDLTAVDHEYDALDLCRDALDRAVAEAEGRLLAARLRLTGATPLHTHFAGNRERIGAELRSAAAGAVGQQLWLERVVLDTTAPAEAAVLDSGPLAELLGHIEALAEQPDALAALAAELRALDGKMPRVLRDNEDGPWFDGPEAVARYLREALPIIHERLRGEAG
jgi:DNA repair exonuclease SbcCD nuclease subunit